VYVLHRNNMSIDVRMIFACLEGSDVVVGGLLSLTIRLSI
jgi:hypothetical protein